MKPRSWSPPITWLCLLILWMTRKHDTKWDSHLMLLLLSTSWLMCCLLSRQLVRSFSKVLRGSGWNISTRHFKNWRKTLPPVNKTVCRSIRNNLQWRYLVSNLFIKKLSWRVSSDLSRFKRLFLKTKNLNVAKWHKVHKLQSYRNKRETSRPTPKWESLRQKLLYY